MEMKLKIRVIDILFLNIILLLILYNIPIKSEILSNICLIKRITGHECWNCGMTRAFLSVLHFDFYSAYNYNPRVIVVFPITIGVYINAIFKNIFIKGEITNE